MLMQFSTLKSRLFSIYDPIDLKILTKLILKFSYLNEHKFHHFFRNAESQCVTVVLILKQLGTFSCVANYFLASEKQVVLDDLYLIDPPILSNLGFFHMK